MSMLQKAIVIIVMVTLSACSQNPIVPPEAVTPILDPTATPTMGSTLYHGGTVGPSTPQLSTQIALATVATQAGMFSDFSPILYAKKYDANTFFILLGGLEGGEWLAPEQAFALSSGEREYDVYSLAGQKSVIRGHSPESSRINQAYFVGSDVSTYEFGMVGVAQGWQVMQRNVEELPSENDLYKQIVADWLTQAGVINPQPGTIQIHSVDLEGDGANEIFISATRVESQHTTREGDHSIILMRKVIGNEAVTIPIVVDFYASLKGPHPFPCTYSVGNFIDLNRDGTLEVIVEFERWEGFGGSVFQVTGKNVEEVLGATCVTP